MKAFMIGLLLTLIAWFLFPDYAFSQCAMCKASAEQADAEAVNGLNAGILYLMAFPYILFGLIGYFWYRNSKKDRQKADAVETRIKKHISTYPLR